MYLNNKEENELKSRVVEHLNDGRDGWDLPHTLACVYWMKQLVKKEGGNPRILIPAIYLHDIGYMEKKFEFDPVGNLDIKKEHMEKGAIIAEEILNSLGSFSNNEIREICDLIKIHDNLEKLKNKSSKHEQLILEADSLGQIDTDRVTPTFSKEIRIKFLDRFEKNRATLFKTKTGKKMLNKLLKKARKDSEKIT